jgi:hypothetical protein
MPELMDEKQQAEEKKRQRPIQNVSEDFHNLPFEIG